MKAFTPKMEVFKMEKMSHEGDMVMGKESIRESIKKEARQMEMLPPTVRMESHSMPMPEPDALDSESDVAKLVKDVAVAQGDSGKSNDGHLMDENDQACYSSRYNDLNGKPAKEHFRLVGAGQGRLSHCARSLTDYEASTYLHAFPEL